MNCSLDCIPVLRSLLMLYIVGFWHIQGYDSDLDFFRSDATKLGAFIALSGFFCLSGYLLTLSHQRAPKPAKIFYLKRLGRVYPLYVLALMVFIISPSYSFTTMEIIAAVTLTSALLDLPIPTLWFVNVLMLYYLILPFLWRFNTIQLLKVLGVVLVSMMAIKGAIGLIDARIIGYAPSFFLGIIGARSHRVASAINKPATILYGLAGLTALYMAYSLLEVPESLLKIKSIGIQAAIPVLAMPALLYLGRLIAKAGFNNFWHFISYASFCAYLFHRGIYEMMFESLPDTSGVIVSLAVCYGVAVPVVILFSGFLQKVYDLSVNAFITYRHPLKYNNASL